MLSPPISVTPLFNRKTKGQLKSFGNYIRPAENVLLSGNLRETRRIFCHFTEFRYTISLIFCSINEALSIFVKEIFILLITNNVTIEKSDFLRFYTFLSNNFCENLKMVKFSWN